MTAVALLICSAVLFYFSFPNYFFVQGAPFLAWGCAFPLLFLLDGKKWQQRACWGLAWGLVSHMLLVSWLIPVSVGGWGIFSLALSVQGVVFALFFPAGGIPATIRLFFIPCAWVVSEWVRTFILGGFAWGLGYSQAPVPEMIQSACIGGPYAAAWLILLVNASVYLSWRAQGSRRRFLVIGAAVLVVFLLGGTIRMVFSGADAAARMRVAVVQANIAREEKTREDLYDDHVARHLALMKKAVMAGRTGPEDIVVWPETAFTDDILTDLKWRPRLEAAARNFRTNILVGSALLWDGRDLNSALLLSPDGTWRGVYHKVHLVPFTEFTPQGAAVLARWFRLGKYHFSAGTRPGILSLAGGRGFGVAICSEELYPGTFRHLARAPSGRPGPVIVMLNDGWFSRREALFIHALAGPLRAVETGRAVVRAANTGRSMAFDGFGRILGRPLETGRPDSGVYDIPLSEGVTFYAEWGDVFALMCLMFVIIILMVFHLKRIRTGARHVI